MQFVLKGHRHVWGFELSLTHVRLAEVDDDIEDDDGPGGSVHCQADRDFDAPEGVGTAAWGSKVASVKAHGFGFGVHRGEEI
jgi:hypothetical protein